MKNKRHPTPEIQSSRLLSNTLRLDDEVFQNVSPPSIFRRLSRYADSFWLDSAQSDGPGWSYLGAHAEPDWPDPFSVPSIPIHVHSTVTSVTQSEAVATPPFSGGWVGLLGYEIINTSANLFHFDSLCKFFPTLLAYSHLTKSWSAVTLTPAHLPEHERLEMARAQIKTFLNSVQLDRPAPPETSATPPAPRAARSNFSRETYMAAVNKALEYIAAGDIYQVNLAQRLTVPWSESPELLYARLREQSPAQFGAYLGPAFFGAPFAVASISPELFLRVQDRNIETRPIKGTRARHDDASLGALARELDCSPKERAELNMILDLERNDLGKICEYNSVSVASAGEIEILPTLIHRVGKVRGTLRANVSPREIFEATFPGGSVTGAPKRRAMQIIQELEPAPRGPYCGAIGWIGATGGMEFNLAIRTAVYDGTQNLVHYHAGSGIVADSDPRAEYEETLQKARAFLEAANAKLKIEN